MTPHRADTIDQGGRPAFLTRPVGGPTAVTDALGTAAYAYNADDELTDKIDRNGRRTQYVYDGAGRRTQERWLDGSGSILRTISSTYDAVDQLTSVIDPDSTLTFSYDAAGQVLTAGTSSPAGQPSVTLTTAYDRAGRRKTLTDNLSSVGQTSYTYDTASRLTSLSRTVGGTAGPKVEFGYDNADRLTSLRRTNGDGGGGGLEGGGLEGGGGGGGTAITTTIGYDAADRLTSMIHQVVGGATLATYAYGYDNANRVSSETNAEGTAGYAYDVTNQLTGVSGARTEAYGYDLAGNRNTTGYATTTGNRMTASPGATYTYDGEGNRIGKTDTSTGNTTAYAYDYRNRLTSVVERNAGGTLLHQVTYTYDAIDRRIGVNTDGTQTWTVYDGQNPYADFNSGGTLATRYLYGPAVDMLLARTSAGGTTAWYLTDRLGSIRDIASTAGTVLDHVSYDSFGNVLSESSPANGDAFKYTSREWNAIASLQFNRARYYDPTAGRWVARDPIGFTGGDINMLRYVNNNPMNRLDPLGLWYIDINFVILFPALDTLLPVGGGVQIGMPSKTGGWYTINPYVGLQLPGISIGEAIDWPDAEPQRPAPGLNYGGGISFLPVDGAWVGGQVGWGGGWGKEDATPFSEVNVSPIPGLNLGIWLVSPDINPMNCYEPIRNFVHREGAKIAENLIRTVAHTAREYLARFISDQLSKIPVVQ